MIHWQISKEPKFPKFFTWGFLGRQAIYQIEVKMIPGKTEKQLRKEADMIQKQVERDKKVWLRPGTGRPVMHYKGFDFTLILWILVVFVGFCLLSIMLFGGK